MPKRAAQPALSALGQQTLEQYAAALREREDIRPVTLRNYLSDLRQFAAWFEATAAAGQETSPAFGPTELTTPTITRYREYLQDTAHLKPASVNRALISIKRYCAWAVTAGQIGRDPTQGLKMVGQEDGGIHHVTDTEEDALLKAVTAGGSVRDRTVIVLMLHTGVRVHEVCQLKREHLTLNKRSGSMQVHGKRNKYREVPHNATARKALEDYLVTMPNAGPYLFMSEKTGQALTERGLGYMIKKYMRAANLAHVRPHDLRHRFGYRMAQVVPLHRLAQIMGHDSLDTTMIYIKATKADLQQAVEKIAWA
jgi:integrase/recombinase XerC